MIHLFQLGPVQLAKGHSWFVGAVEGDVVLAPQAEHTREAALAAMIRGRPPATLRCDPALADLAGPLGIETAPLPELALEVRAVLAFALAAGPTAPRPDRGLTLLLLDRCAELWKARPWERFDSDAPLALSLREGGRTVRRELSVMGSVSDERGLALYFTPGSVARILELDDDARAAQEMDGLHVSFEEEPAWAVEAFEAHFHVPRLPLLMRTKKGRLLPPSARELAELTAAIEALLFMCAPDAPAEADTGEVELDLPGHRFTARIELPTEPELVATPTAGLRGARAPRNAPCPCGSGRKYKKCHLAEDEARRELARGEAPGSAEARATERRLAERDPVHALDERIQADAMALARRRWGHGFDPDGALARIGYDFAASQYVSGWSSSHYRGPDGRTALELYLEERGGALDAPGRRLVEAQSRAWFAPQEVLAATPGVSIRLRDLLEGGERIVEEKSASRTLVARDVILARVLDLGDRHILGGCHPRVLPPREGELVRAALRTALGGRGKKVSAAKLREGTAAGLPLEFWQRMVQTHDERPPPRLRNTDGEELIVTVDHFDLAPGRRDEALALISGLPDAQRDEADDGDEAVVSFVKEGNAMGALPTTLVGRAIVRGEKLRLETNSLQRADRLRRLVTERLGGGVATFRVREHTDPAGMVAAGPAAPSRAEEPPPEVREAVRRMKEEYSRRWLDVPVPALGGLTPRQAAGRKGPVRRELELLLAGMENAEARQPEDQRCDVQALRRELGMA